MARAQAAAMARAEVAAMPRAQAAATARAQVQQPARASLAPRDVRAAIPVLTDATQGLGSKDAAKAQGSKHAAAAQGSKDVTASETARRVKAVRAEPVSRTWRAGSPASTLSRLRMRSAPCTETGVGPPAAMQPAPRSPSRRR